MLTPTLFGVFFALVLGHAFGLSQERVYLCIGFDGGLFNLALLRAWSWVWGTIIGDMLFANHAVVEAHLQAELQSLIERFSHVCGDFGLTVDPKRTSIFGQYTPSLPVITIDDCRLDAIRQFAYVGSTIPVNTLLDTEIGGRVGGLP